MKKKENDNEIEEKPIIDDPLYHAIEDKRLEFSKQYKKFRTINMVVLVVMLAAVIGFSLLMTVIPTWIVLIIIVVVLIGSFAYTSVRRKKTDKLTNDFIQYYYDTINTYSYSDDVNFSEISGHPFEKIKPEEFVNAGFVQNVTHIGSRNCVYGKMAGLDFKAANAVARVTTNNVTETAFLGEFFQIQLDKSVTGKTAIYFGPEANNGAGPNDLDGLDEITSSFKGLNENVKVWSSCKKVDKLITKEVIDAINAFEPNKVLEDVCVVIKSNACYVALSYGDDMMVLPLLEEFKYEPQKQHKVDVEKVAVLAKALRKNVLNNEFAVELSDDEPAPTTNDNATEIKEEEPAKEETSTTETEKKE